MKRTLSDSLAKAYSLGKKRGYLTYDELNNLLPPGPPDLSVLDEFLDGIFQEGILLLPSPLKEVKKEKSHFSSENSLAFYMERMGKYSLLSPRTEVKLTTELKRVEEQLFYLVLSRKEPYSHFSSMIGELLLPSSPIYSHWFSGGESEKTKKVLRKLLRLLSKKPEEEKLRKAYPLFTQLPWIQNPILPLAQTFLSAFPPSEQRQLKALLKKQKNLRNRLVEANLRLVVNIATKYHRFFPSVPLVDLIQEGNVGLIRAGEKFDPSMGTRFSTYATFWIRQSILRYLEDKESFIRVPAHYLEKVKKELLLFPGEGDEKGEILRNFRKPLSLDNLLFSLPEGDIEDPVSSVYVPSPLEEVMEKEIQDLVKKILEELSPLEREVLTLRFGIGGDPPMTLEEIGKKLSFSRERIRQIEKEALFRLRAILSSRNFWKYLEE
jgi:RNA polymerase primary sigma factor